MLGCLFLVVGKFETRSGIFVSSFRLYIFHRYLGVHTGSYLPFV